MLLEVTGTDEDNVELRPVLEANGADVIAGAEETSVPVASVAVASAGAESVAVASTPEVSVEVSEAPASVDTSVAES